MALTVVKRGWVVSSVSAALALSQTPVAIRAQPVQDRPRAVLQGPAELSAAPIIRDPLNRSCLELEAIARPHVVNPVMFDHVVSAKNNCPRQIKVKVCYYNSDKCNEITVPGYGRQDTILGTISGVKYFRYVISRQQ